MTRLDMARKRLADAVARLESAAAQAPRADGADREALAGALAESREECDRMRREAHAAADQLDRTIARVQDLVAR